MFYYYYDQLCKAINSSLRITHKVTNTYGKIVHFITYRHHIYLQPHAQEGGKRHIGYYRMTTEDVGQVIKDQTKIWIEMLEKAKDKGKGKEMEAASQTRKDPEKEKAKIVLEKDAEQIEKRKTFVGEKRPRQTNTGSSPRKKMKSSRPTYQAVLHEDYFESIADKVYNTISELITTITTTQEALKQTIETQLMELRMLVSHAPQVDTPSATLSAIIDQEGNQHRFVEIMSISIHILVAQEGVQEGVA